MPEHRTNFYCQLSYDEYKELERQLRDWESIETSHTTVEGYYHKALRIKIGTTLFEFQGPTVKAPDPRDGEFDENYRLRGCRAGSDGDCNWVPCPQARDGEPSRSQRHCPLDVAFPRQGRAGG